MPFANVRVRMHFEMPGCSWSEAHYRAAESITDSLMVTANQLCDKRIRCLCKFADLHSYSVNAVQERRKGMSRRKNNGGGFLFTPRDANNAVVRVMLLAGANKRDYALHGCPDSDVVFSANTGQDVTVASAELGAYLDYLTLPGNGWQMRAETKRAGDPANPTIKDITLDAVGVKFEIAGAAPAVNDKFKVSGCKGWFCNQFNGDWKAAIVAGQFVTCLTTRKIDQRFQYIKASGQLRIVNDAFYTYAGYAGWDQLSVVSGTRDTTSKKK